MVCDPTSHGTWNMSANPLLQLLCSLRQFKVNKEECKAGRLGRRGERQAFMCHYFDHIFILGCLISVIHAVETLWLFVCECMCVRVHLCGSVSDC